MEFSDKGDLYARIQAHAKIKKYIKEKEVWRVFIQLVQALKVLHDS
jgi:serine/threonine protein kinase